MAALTRQQAERLLAGKAGRAKASVKRIAARTGKHRTGAQAGQSFSEEAVGKVLDMARATAAGIKLQYLRAETTLVKAILATLDELNGVKPGEEGE